MEYSTLVDLVTSIGFPISCCIALFWYVNNIQNLHREELLKLSESIDKNSDLICELSTLIKNIKV